MPTRSMHQVVHTLRKITMREAAQRTDEQLLESFLDQSDPSAFESLVRRHGPMVLAVCRRILKNRHDAEDAFQATFLVLVRKAPSLGRRHLLANWLYGVAYRTALKARGAAARRRAKEQHAARIAPPQPSAERLPDDLLARLDSELNRLPEKYRIPVILCDLQGLSRTAAARQVGWRTGTLNWRLAQARALLAKRLVRYGLALSGGAWATAVAQPPAFADGLPSMVAATVRGAAAVATGRGAVAGVVPGNVAMLVQGVVQTMLLSKLKTVVAMGLLVALAACGGGLLSYRSAVAQASAPGTEDAADASSRLTPPAVLSEPEPQPLWLGQAASDYEAIFTKAVQVVGDYFEVNYTNRYEGRIETFPRTRQPRRTPQADQQLDPVPSVRSKAVVSISRADTGGFFVEVVVLRDVRTGRTWKPVGRDNELERTILRRLAADAPQAGTRVDEPPTATPAAPAPSKPEEDNPTALEEADNFRVNAPTLAIARRVRRAAERYRKEKALEWLGHELPRWPQPCPIEVKITLGGTGSATSFAFDRGKILDQKMYLESSLDQILSEDLPHEITHVVLAHHFGSPVPRWADEGAAVLSSSNAERRIHEKELKTILAKPGRFIPLRRLFPEPDYPPDHKVLYAEGYSVTRFLVAAKDRGTFLAFLVQGKRDGWDIAVKQHYGYANVDALEKAWLLSLNNSKKPANRLDETATRRADAERKLEQAFGKDSKDIQAAAIQLDLPSRGLVLAANQFSILEDGRIKLSPCWYASFESEKITTIRCDEAVLSIDGSISGLEELARRKILAIEPSGHVRITFR